MSCCSTQPKAVAPAAAGACCGGGGHLRRSSEAGGGEWALLGLLIVLAGLAMNVSLALNLTDMTGELRLWVHGGLALGGVVAVGLTWGELVKPAWQALRDGRLVTEHLFLAGIAAAWAVSLHATLTGSGAVFYEVPILLPAIRQFGAIMLGRQRRNIEAISQELLAGLVTARVMRDGRWSLLPLPEVALDDRLWVMPGEVIPADGVITDGRSFVQTRNLTGEPYPIVMETGDAVQSGMIALDGELRVQVSSLPAASGISRIAAATRALLDRPPVFLRSVQNVLRWFFPTVLLVSLATAVFWAWRANWTDWTASIHHALAVVLIACPCAFGMALPLLFRRGLSSCLRRGIQATDAAFMEALAMVKVVAFDKTGTLTTPEITVTGITCAPGVPEPTLRAVLAALHLQSNHPVARPFWAWAAATHGLELRHLRVLPGRGLEAELRSGTNPWQSVRVGSHHLMEMPLPAWAEVSAESRRILVSLDGQLAGVCHLAEQLRSSACAACEKLAAGGWRTAVITGDSRVPRDLLDAVNECHLSQSPQQKAELVQQWERQAMPVMFLGDGPNDAPALAAATASVAVEPDSDLVADSAHAYWHDPDLAALPGLMTEAAAFAARARLILRVSITYNLLGMTVAAAGWLHPAAAALIMWVSSATVMALAARPLAQPAQFPR